MRIAFIAIKGMPIGGGIEKLTEEIGSRLRKKGHKILVYCSRDYGTSDGVFKGMDIKTVSSINTKAFHKISICFNAVLDVILNEKVDIVHIHAVGPSIFSIFPRLFGIPTIVQTHGIEWKRDKWGIIGKNFLKLVEFSAIYFPNKTTAVSMIQKRYYEERFGKEVIYIPTGVNEIEIKKPKWLITKGLKKNNYILFAARLVEEKGAHYLIKAFRNIDTEKKLVIAGDANHAEKYKKSLREFAGDDERIIFAGFITGRPLEELFSNAYIFCLPSTIEGLPIALLEAMSFGNCCLASDIPENNEAAQGYAYFFKNRNEKDLEKKIKMLIENPKMVEDKRKIARKHVIKNYSWNNITEQIEKLYITIIHNKC
jgi:glycosyltransferase involved in cell wall biosynthesis